MHNIITTQAHRCRTGPPLIRMYTYSLSNYYQKLSVYWLVQECFNLTCTLECVIEYRSLRRLVSAFITALTTVTPSSIVNTLMDPFFE